MVALHSKTKTGATLAATEVINESIRQTFVKTQVEKRFLFNRQRILRFQAAKDARLNGFLYFPNDAAQLTRSVYGDLSVKGITLCAHDLGLVCHPRSADDPKPYALGSFKIAATVSFA
jgi:hypothetical protein